MIKRFWVSLIFAAVFASMLMAQSASITLAWDPKPADQTWQYVRIYERIGTAPNYTYTKVAEVDGNLVTATISGVIPGAHTYIARAFNMFESGNSNAVSTPAVPGSPGGLKITITIIVTP